MRKTKDRGITLVALVVTIVVLIILATISINIVFGEEGILTRARQAKDYMSNAQVEEQTMLNEMYVSAFGNQLPENTKENPQEAGKEVALKPGWGTETVTYIKTADGKENTAVTKVATVYAVSVGNGETVPVPKEFYYVGGNLSSGVVISDNVADKNKYINAENGVVPAGISINEDGELERTLQGNQFVWIPCEKSEYKKSSVWNSTTQYYTSSSNYKLANANWDTTTSDSELTQIEKYGGFYVARYEAGLAETIDEFEDTQKHTGSNTIYNEEGVPKSRAGEIPWMFIDWTTAKKNAKSMYESSKHKNYVSSGLITGTQWDVMLNKLLEKNKIQAADLTNSSSWGNYRNTSISYVGRLAKAYYSSSSWYLPKFGELTEGTTTTYNSDNTYGDLLTTGASESAARYNIYDVAGNLWEWTEEDSHYATSGQYRVLRGGSSVDASGAYPVCFRNGGITVSYTSLSIGFREVLYMK